MQTTIDFYDYRMRRKEARKAGKVSLPLGYYTVELPQYNN